MKLPSILSLLALVVSVYALILALSLPRQVSEKEIREMVDAALQEKERSYVRDLAPKVDRIYRDMLGPRYQTPEKPPETFRELFLPLHRIIEGMSNGPSSGT